MRKIAWISFLVIAASCAPPKGEPTLRVILTPSWVSDATPVRVKVVGSRADGTIATGSVRITSAHGTLVEPVELQFDGFGTAQTDLTCDPVAEPACSQAVRVVANWTADGVAVSAEARLNSRGSSPLGGGAGGASGTGGGAGGGGGGAGGGGGSAPSAAYVIGTVDGSAEIRAFTPLNAPMNVLGLLPSQLHRVTIRKAGQIFYTRQFGSVHTPIFQVVADPVGSTNPEANDLEVPNTCGPAGIDFLAVWPDTDTLAVSCLDASYQDPSLGVPPGLRVVALGSWLE